MILMMFLSSPYLPVTVESLDAAVKRVFIQIHRHDITYIHTHTKETYSSGHTLDKTENKRYLFKKKRRLRFFKRCLKRRLLADDVTISR